MPHSRSNQDLRGQNRTDVSGSAVVASGGGLTESTPQPPGQAQASSGSGLGGVEQAAGLADKVGATETADVLEKVLKVVGAG